MARSPKPGPAGPGSWWVGLVGGWSDQRTNPCRLHRLYIQESITPKKGETRQRGQFESKLRRTGSFNSRTSPPLSYWLCTTCALLIQELRLHTSELCSAKMLEPQNLENVRRHTLGRNGSLIGVYCAQYSQTRSDITCHANRSRGWSG